MKNYVFTSDKGSLKTYNENVLSQGRTMAQALAFLKTLPADATVAVLPEGVMLNFMSGKTASTKYFEFAPSFFNMEKESVVLEGFKAVPPDYIVLLDRDMSEHGARYFGMDYAKDLFFWLARHYEPVQLIGSMPNTGKGFGILIAKKIRP
jgi:hypothetical protein